MTEPTNGDEKRQKLQEDSKNEDKKEEQKAAFVSSKELSRGKWLSLNEITYTDPAGKTRQWEATERTHKHEGSVDCVVIIATLHRVLKVDCVVVVKQFRPPLKAYTIEFPAGLVDGSESVSSTAVRELKEETGYTGVVKHVSPGTCLDPGTESCVVALVTMEIDGDSHVNKNPTPHTDEGEFVEVILIPVAELLKYLNDYDTSGCVIDSRTYTYAVALEQAEHRHRPHVPTDTNK